MKEPSFESDKLFGDLLVEQGLSTHEHVRECFALQEELRSLGSPSIPKLGELLLQKRYISPDAYQQTVVLQTGYGKMPSDSPVSAPLPPEVERASGETNNWFGKYVRVFPIGSGGMGEVWKSWDTGLERWVALKFLKSADSHDLLRFRREAQTASQVEHPHIASIYEVGEKDGVPYIAMQYVEGVTLSAFPRNDIRELVRLMRDAAQAAHAAHQKGIIHRDLKPANLMVAQKETAHVYVMDFGLAKETEVDTSISQSGLVLGTPAYMSPEQARGRAKDLDARSDVYSLGATFYELLTGRPPFRDVAVLERLRKVVEKDPKPVRKRNPAIEPDLETIVMKCLQKEPEKRYPTAAALAEDLGRYLEGDPISARPIGAVEKISRWTKRNRALTATLATLVMVMMAGGIFFYRDVERRKAELLAEIRVDVNGVLDEVRLGDLLENPVEKEKAKNRLLKYRHPETVGILAAELDLLTASVKKTGKLNGKQERYLPFLCEILGLLEIQEGAVEALGRYLEAERAETQLRAVPAGEALCLLGGRKADRLLLQARILLGVDGRFWRKVRRLYARIEVEPKLEIKTASGYNNRGSAREAKGDLDGAIADYTRAVELDSKLAVAWTNRGNVRRKNGEVDGPIVDYTRAIELDPKYTDAWNNRGLVRAGKNDFDGAIADYTHAIELDSKMWIAWINRGNARAAKGDLEGAILDLTWAIQLDAKTASAWTNRGNARYKMGDLDGAIGDHTRAIELDPKYGKAWNNRGAARREKEDLDGAIKDFTRAIELDPKNTDAWNNRGATREAREDLDGAIADYTRAIELDPEFVLSWSNRGNARRENGDLAEAIVDYDRALTLDPTSADTWNNRGIARKAKGDLEGAIGDFTHALEIDPEDLIIWTNRGIAWLQKGDLEKTISDWEQVLKLAPDHFQAPVFRAEIKRMRRELRDRDKK